MIRLDDDTFIDKRLIFYARFAPVGDVPFMFVLWRATPSGKLRRGFFEGSPNDFERALREG